MVDGRQRQITVAEDLLTINHGDPLPWRTRCFPAWRARGKGQAGARICCMFSPPPGQEQPYQHSEANEPQRCAIASEDWSSHRVPLMPRENAPALWGGRIIPEAQDYHHGFSLPQGGDWGR